MLINSRIFICITLICLSSHACHARPLGNRLLSKKNEMRRLSLSEKVGVTNDKESMVKVSINKDEEYAYYKQMNSKIVEEKMQMERLTETISDDAQANDRHQAVPVAWHMPHKKTRHPQPRFNLDYEPPQTHPPSHNR